jgi:hypothetical protein
VASIDDVGNNSLIMMKEINVIMEFTGKIFQKKEIFFN